MALEIDLQSIPRKTKIWVK